MAEQRAKKHGDDWLVRLLAGDGCAFAEFVDKYKGMVFLCCRTLGLSNDESEDVASEVFLAAYRGLKGYRGQSRLSTWLWRITYYKAVSYLRKKKGKFLNLHEIQLADSVDRREERPEAVVENREKEEIIWQAVKKLPKLWAMAVILYYREEKKVADIAKIMRIRQNTVKTYLFRGRQRLKETLGGALGEDIDGR